MLKFWIHETRMSNIPQARGEKKGSCCYLKWHKLEIESDDSDDNGILNAFTTIVDPTEGVTEIVDDEEDLVDSKFEKMDDQDDIHTAYAKLYKVSKKHEKLYRLATKKLSDVKLDQEELFSKVDEANRTIGALWFENNFYAERTKRSLKQNYSKSKLNY